MNVLLKLVLQKGEQELIHTLVCCSACTGVCCVLTSQLLSTDRGQTMRVVLADKSSGSSVMEDSTSAQEQDTQVQQE